MCVAIRSNRDLGRPVRAARWVDEAPVDPLLDPHALGPMASAATTAAAAARRVG
jgi:hypothetical protein